jgi:acyl-CoA thioesterase I
MKQLIILFLAAFYFLACNNKKENNNTGNQQTKPKDTATVKKTIVFFGNSLTAGYGLSPAEAFPAIIQKKIDSLDLPYKVVNAGVSGETSSGGDSRIDWILRTPVDVFILELGANDGLRGIPLGQTKKNLQSILDKVKQKYPACKLLLAGMQIPPNMGQTYTSQFRDMYQDLASSNNVTLIPFILEGVGGEDHLNQEDGIHPTAEGHMIVAGNVWKKLSEIL